MALICLWCSKTTKGEDDIVSCTMCSKPYHAVKCLNFPRSALKNMKEVRGFQWFCENCNDTNLTSMMCKQFAALEKKIDDLVLQIDLPDLKSKQGDLFEKLDHLTQEVSSIKSIVNAPPVGVKRNRQGSFRNALALQQEGVSSDVFEDFGNQPVRPRTCVQVVTGTVDSESQSDSSDEIKVIQNPDWFHVSQFDPNIENDKMKAWFVKILESDEIQCIKLIPKNRILSELSFVSFKLGVCSNLVSKVMDPKTWLKGITVRPFQERSNASRNFRFA